MQDLLVLGVVPGTNYVIPMYFWILFGFFWILLFWNIDKIRLYHQERTLHRLQQATTNVTLLSTSALGSTLVYTRRFMIAGLFVCVVAGHTFYKAVKQFVLWADKKANSVHASDLKKFIPSGE